MAKPGEWTTFIREMIGSFLILFMVVSGVSRIVTAVIVDYCQLKKSINGCQHIQYKNSILCIDREHCITHGKDMHRLASFFFFKTTRVNNRAWMFSEAKSPLVIILLNIL